MDGGMKTLLLVLVILYCVMPDPVPGPLDDAIIVLCAVAAGRRSQDYCIIFEFKVIPIYSGTNSKTWRMYEIVCPAI